MSDNLAGSSGGGISACASPGDIVTITSSTIENNTAADWGGGIASLALPDVCGPLVLASTNVTGNTVTGGSPKAEFFTPAGGGILTTPGLHLQGSTTVTGNVSSGVGGGIATIVDIIDPINGDDIVGPTPTACDNLGSAPRTGTLTPNTPDDAPTPTHVTCP